ncbi:MAG: cupin domain-containing protein [Bacteroidetes bacterium]|nr:MAG: cupin domain-containing protein [Bacteroidota bacterium]
MNIEKVNIGEKLGLFSDHWNPRIVGELNGQLLKLVKFQGDFIWHKHDHEDEMFLVIKGKFKIELREKTIELNPGEFVIIPKGVEHKPSSVEESHVLLFEPASTLNTGNIKNERTREKLESI